MKKAFIYTAHILLIQISLTFNWFDVHMFQPNISIIMPKNLFACKNNTFGTCFLCGFTISSAVHGHNHNFVYVVIHQISECD